ncbi:efflux transporter outer membrane subunit [uncultured Desulfobulbus sp.]|uniref:efflux transporter outer membrane subunit n=1 Tax=uncultured Desulfobulbus sp. TaxID=239745 RepID=UPI0029C95AAA|nr:efflux transporter outer membrane subunit [uncultured Desulfobulbus sp.]
MNNRCRPAFMVLAWGLTLLTACSPVGPDYQEPKPEMPARWSEASQQVREENETALHRWWAQFKDPVLDSLITRAVTANPDIKIAETRIREARAQRGIAVAGGLPSLDIGASAINSRRSEHVSSGGQTQDLFQANFDAGWEIDVFGGNRRQVEAAEAYLAATVEDKRDVFVSLAAEVARSYLELRASQHRLAIARENSRTQEQTVELVRNKFQIGLGGELEVAQAETLLAQTTAQIPALDSSAIQAMHQLALLLGQQPHTLKAELITPTPTPPVPPQLPAVLPSELLRQRPDIRSAERQLAAATATVGVATAELFPRFSLSALIGAQSLSLDTLITKGSRFWSVGPAVRWPLFDGGTARATLEISEARRERAQVTYEKTVLSALAEAENGLVSLDRERATQKMLGEAVRASERAVVIARGQYKAGITTFLNILQSENALYQSQDKLAQSDQRLALNMIALYKALGGGWQNQPLTPAAMPGTNSPEYRTPARNVP